MASAPLLDRSDVLCYICLGILLEPVTLPCKHRICHVCLRRSLEINRLCCPLCKRRISVWVRRNADSLVDVPLWETIRTAFPQEVAARQAEEEAAVTDPSKIDLESLDELFPCVPAHMHVEHDGDIGKEFMEEMTRFRESERIRNEQEEEQSMALIAQFQQEEEEAKAEREQLKKDEELARQLQQDEEKRMAEENEPRQSESRSPFRPASSSKKTKSKVLKETTSNRLRQLSLKQYFQSPK